MKKEHSITLSLFLFYLVLLTWIILFKSQCSLSGLSRIRSVNLIPYGACAFTNGKIDFDEIFGNILVFVPVGIYVSMLKPGWSFVKRLLPAFGVSLFYEVMQFALAIGASDITDLINNTSGGLIGVVIYLLFQKIFGKKACRVLLICAGICTVLLVALIAVLLFTK